MLETWQHSTRPVALLPADQGQIRGGGMTVMDMTPYGHDLLSAVFGIVLAAIIKAIQSKKVRILPLCNQPCHYASRFDLSPI